MPNQSPLRYSLVLIGALLIALAIAWQIINQANRNRHLQRQADRLQAEIELLQQTNKNQHLINEFLQTGYYLDFAIRQQQGYTLPGESLLIISEEKIEGIHQDYANQIPDESGEDEPTSTWHQWRHFFFGR